MMTRTTSGDAAGLRIRPARAEDAGEIARFFLIASDGLAAYIWSGMAQPGEPLAAVGARRYARTATPFSYENCLLAVRGDAVLGMGHAFPMPPRAAGEVEDDPVLAPYAALEDPGSLYVAGLAVDAAARGDGIGTLLMDSLEARARDEGCPRTTLICFEANTRALAFYRRRGYHELDRRPIVPHPALRYREGDAVLLAREV